MVVISNALLAMLSTNRQAVKQFPFLKIKTKGATTCCGAPTKTANYNAAKASIARLSGQKLTEFKALVGADKIKVIFLNGRKTETKEL